MKFSIIILNYNVKHFVAACLQTVQKAVAGKDAEIIVADNASTDGSRDYLESRFKQVKFLWFDQNYGFAKAYNKAVKQAQGEYLLILNPDTLVSENLLDELEKFAELHPGFGIIGGKMIDGTGRFLPESKRGVPFPITAFSRLTGLYKILQFKPFNTYYASHLKENQSGKVAVLTGAFMFMHKATYEKAGGFDERYFMYGEDIDLSYTVSKSGKTNFYLPSAKIIHFKGESSRKDQQYFNNFFESTFEFYHKHFRCFPVQEFLMKQFFKLWFKLRKNRQFEHPPADYKSVVFAGSEKEFQKLQKLFPAIVHSPDIPAEITTESLLIVDTSAFPFSQIIQSMESNPAHYRFYFPGLNLLIGSDDRNHTGHVQLIS